MVDQYNNANSQIFDVIQDGPVKSVKNYKRKNIDETTEHQQTALRSFQHENTSAVSSNYTEEILPARMQGIGASSFGVQNTTIFERPQRQRNSLLQR